MRENANEEASMTQAIMVAGNGIRCEGKSVLVAGLCRILSGWPAYGAV